jgi:hypothetical protein
MSNESTQNNIGQPAHHSMLDIIKQAFTVPKSEIDRREAEWRKAQHKRGRPKKAKKISLHNGGALTNNE